MKRKFSALGQMPFEMCMDVGQTAHISPYANQLWNDSGIDIGSGQMYEFAVPTGEQWINGGKACGADGYPSNLLTRPWEILRRIPNANWLQLIGMIGRSTKPAIVIGSRLSDFSPQYPGRLYFFANDLPWMYWNDKGMLAVQITRTK